MEIWIPENFAPYATPTAQWEFGTAAISPAHLVPWWFESEIISMKSSYILLVPGYMYCKKYINDTFIPKGINSSDLWCVIQILFRHPLVL